MEAKSIKKNILMNSILTISNFIFPIITYSYVSRTLLPIGVGKVAFVSSIISYFSYFAALGIPVYGLREAAKIRDDKDKLSKFVHEVFILNVLSTILSYIVLIGSVLSIPKFNEYKTLFYIISLSIGLNTIGMEWLYSALEEYSYITKRSIIFKCIYIPLIFLLIKNTDDYIWYGFLTVFVSSANYICNFINIHKYINFKYYKDYEIKKHLKPIFILFFASIIITIYANFDISMIGFIKNEFEVGLYNSALKIKNIILSLSTAMTGVLIPRISHHVSRGEYDSIKKLEVLSLTMSILLAFPIAIYIFMYPENILIFLSGKDYLSATNTLRTLMLCVFPLILTNLFGNQLLIPLGKEKVFSRSVFIGMFINLILNFLLIPKYGSFGAAIGTLVTEVWNAVYMGIGVKDYIQYLFKNTKKIIYIIAIGVSILISHLVYNKIQYLSNLMQLIISAIFFFTTYYILLFILKEPLLIEEFNKLKSKIFYRINRKKKMT